MELKCPFCKETLLSNTNECEPQIYSERLYCPKCKKSGEYELWKSLIDIYKKLDIAVGVLDFVWNHWADCDSASELGLEAKRAIIQITGKEVK